MFRSGPIGKARALPKAIAAAWRYLSERRKNSKLLMKTSSLDYRGKAIIGESA
jgi:hypothetical protein